MLFKQEKEVYFKPIRETNFCSRNYTEYEKSMELEIKNYHLKKNQFN